MYISQEATIPCESFFSVSVRDWCWQHWKWCLSGFPYWLFSTDFLHFHHAAPWCEASLSLKQCASLTAILSDPVSAVSPPWMFPWRSKVLHNPVHLHCSATSLRQLKNAWECPGHIWTQRCKATLRCAKYWELWWEFSLLLSFLATKHFSCH